MERGKKRGGPRSQSQWFHRDPGSVVAATQERIGDAEKSPVLLGSWLEKHEWLQCWWHRAGGDINREQGSVLGQMGGM